MTYLPVAPNHLALICTRQLPIGSQNPDLFRAILSLKNNKFVVDVWSEAIGKALAGNDADVAEKINKQVQKNNSESLEVYFTITVRGTTADLQFYC